MQIFKEVEKAMSIRPNVGIVRGRTYYPSAAMSVDLQDPSKRIGACVRAEFYRIKKFKVTNPTSVYSNYILNYGKMLEGFMIEQLKVAGIYAGSNEKFVYPNHSLISGEVDIIVKEPDGTYAVIENKSYSSGNYAAYKDLNGSAGRGKIPFTPPKAKMSHMMQSHIYLHALSEINKVYLTYIDRAAGGPEKNIQFTITNSEKIDGNYPHISVERPWSDSPIEYTVENFSIESILDGYAFLHEHVTSDTLPAPTYKIKLSKNEVEEGFLDGTVSKTKYEAYIKNPDKYPCSDWQCSWCGYLDQCKSDQGIKIG